MGRAFSDLGGITAEDKTDPPFKIDSFAVSRGIMREAHIDFTGYFGGFSDDIVADVMRMQGELFYKPEPLDPAFNPLWAQGIPNLGINASVRRAANYTGRPFGIAPAQGLTIESMNDLIDKFRALGDGPFELVYEPYRVTHPNPDGFLVPPILSDALRVKGQVKYPELHMDMMPTSLYDEILESIRENLRQQDLEWQKQICGAFEVDPEMAGLVGTFRISKPDTWTGTMKRRWQSLCGNLRWARERFARRVYEIISEYPFEEQEEDW